MSYASAKGYRAEHAVERLLGSYDVPLPTYRPRAGCHDDIGDLCGLPLVFSIKDHARLTLASWVDDLAVMVTNAHMATGVVWHKRVGRADPQNWYVTTSGRLFIPMLQRWCAR